MAISEVFADSATIGTTEYFLASDSTSATYQTTDGVYQVWLECNNLAIGDQFQVRIYEKVQSASTARVVASWVIAHAQVDPNWVSPSLIFLHGWEISLQKLAGTDRAIAWSIRQVA